MRVIFLLVLLLIAAPVAAQTPTPTPDPTPTPMVVHGDSGDFVIVQQITYGQGGVIVALVLVAGLLLIQISLEVSQWTRQ